MGDISVLLLMILNIIRVSQLWQKTRIERKK
uniref:Uncharacterized protein n=1 Tax=virus sp. ctllZ17 TaxID=2827996 RepID=A0A8S5T9E2_9VIRU|nr:MAG TPA: hypothetical protein [virus sp. ctllZ17]DAN77330.1 MAG TPA: hypothetical protein [Bacteriophage sp.]DAR69898.1 MAG TPA: hypothetical protein [Caudoviricetes sp.]DAW70361.1 MAG TPA: hypothetical protein [Bacteriophage sp.]